MEKVRRCRWCGCSFSLSAFSFGDYCSPKCYYAAKEAEKERRERQEKNNGEKQ